MLTIMKVKNCAIGCALLMVGLGAFGATLEHKKVIVVVDGYSTGKHLAPLFRGNGYEVVHVSSKIGRGLGIPLIGHDYLENIEYTNELAPVLHRLAPYQVQAIIAGAEAGVFLADELSNELKLPTSNSMEQSKARRDKFLMQEALAKNGISSIKQFKSSKVEEVVSWSRTNGIMPIVIKPISSAGTDGVTYCYSEFELREAFRTIMTTPDIYGEKNIEVLAQEMIIGTDPGVEYMVNTVSSFGRHHIAEIWKTRKRVIRNVPLYDSAELVSPIEPEFAILKDYVASVLTALGINHGAGHSEVMLTRLGPILIETAARLGGANDPSALVEANGFSQASLLVDSYIRPDFFNEMCRKPATDLKKRGLITFLLSDIKGMTRSALNKEPIFSLPGFHGLAFGVKKGEEIVQTPSLMNSPGLIFFTGASLDELRGSHLALRSMEQKLYRDMVAPVDEDRSRPSGEGGTADRHITHSEAKEDTASRR